MKRLMLMTAVVLTACGGPLTDTDEANADVRQTTAALKDAAPGPTAPDPFEMCMIVCRAFPHRERVNCELACIYDQLPPEGVAR